MTRAPTYAASDRHLIEKVLGGDQYAFGEIIKNTEALVSQIVYRMIPDREDRKDIAQDVYLKAYHRLSGFRYESKLSTWIARIAYNACLDHLEKKRITMPASAILFYPDADPDKEHPGIAGDHPQADVLLFQKERAAIVKAAIEQLSPLYQTLLTLYHQEEASYAEIGMITGLPEGTVKSYLFRARKALKDRLLVYHKREEL